MGRKKERVMDESWSPFDRTEVPYRSTSVVSSTLDGRYRGEDGSVWGAFRVPLGPIWDAKTDQAELGVSTPLLRFLDALGRAVPVSGPKYRQYLKGSYRKYHLLTVALDQLFEAPAGHPLKGMLDAEYGGARDATIRKVSVVFVDLKPKVRSGSLAAAIESVAGTFELGMAPMEDYDADWEAVRSMAARAGLATATQEEVALARSWWNGGDTSDAYYMSTPTSYHVFDNAAAAYRGAELYRREIPVESWPELGGHRVFTAASVSEIDLPYVSALEGAAKWGAGLVASGAVCVSIRGLLEPGRVTAAVVDQKIAGYEAEIKERFKLDMDETVEQREKLETLASIRGAYAGADAAPTSVETSVVAVFAGLGENLDRLGIPGVRVSPLLSRQGGAVAETWPCSSVRANGVLHDLPIQTVAFSGLCDLSSVGDSPEEGILAGFTETGRQPVWFNPAAASNDDYPPLVGIYGASGSGKTQLMDWMAVQTAGIGHRTVLVNPKEGSDLSPAFREFGGQVVSLADVVSSEGILDPLSLMDDPAQGIDLAEGILSYVNPWGSRGQDMVTPLMGALKHGAVLGERSVLGALRAARADGYRSATDALVEPVEELAAASPLFTALCGSSNEAERLALDSRLTLIQAGDMALTLPDGRAGSGLSQTQKVSVALIRMLVRGTTLAVRPRSPFEKAGVVFFDESWIFLDSAGNELEALGRLAREWRTTLVLGTQRLSDAAGLMDHISSGFVLPQGSREQARIALEGVRLEATEERVRRLTAKARTSDDGSGRSALNWDSMRHLRDDAGKVLRGTLGIYADMHDRAVVTEFRLPEWFLALSSTNVREKAARAGVPG